MKRWYVLPIFAVIAVVGWMSLSSPPRVAADEPKADDEGFVELFNGKDLDGWKIGGKEDGWKVVDG